MNNKISGAQMVLVPIKQLGKNKFPWVENLRNRYIKFIDFYGADYLPGTDERGLTFLNDIFVTIANSSGNKEFIRNLPLERLDYQHTFGVRQEIGSYISLSDCYVNCQNENAINTVAAFVFWYDLPEELIAQTPLEKRDTSRLMVLNREDGQYKCSYRYICSLQSIP